ncbi:LptF/LptG family permease [Echinicola jeungdonensis]|uniref:LptF/LptG family permease n=1 Tax=Echinicola jeungdonensis TaxID=709343 RepID=A0ABV5J5I5_9BACT|nr:LptF/LptG family permease [Echinicola jeungdonensis]MDN3670900.1 LptF/LptG family permease [Echinicola jeungdonensis]
MKKLDKLILGSFLGPFLLTFIVVDFILLTVNMLKYFDEIFGKGLGFGVYMELIAYFVVSISPMALPLAVLLSSLMTFGNLGEHFELTAIKSSGISLLRALMPIGVFVLILSGFAFLSNNYLVPRVNLKTFSLLYDIRMKSPALDIKEGVFYNGIPNYSIKVNKKLDDVRLKDIIIYDHTAGQGNINVILADSGRMEPFFNDRYMKLTLFNGYSYSEEKRQRGIRNEPVNFWRTKFDKNEMVFSLDAFQMKRTPENLWSSNRSIKNISEIKVDLDSMSKELTNYAYYNYASTSSSFSFFTRDDKLEPPQDLKKQKAKIDSIKSEKWRRKMEKDRQKNLAKNQTTSNQSNSSKDTVKSTPNLEEDTISGSIKNVKDTVENNLNLAENASKDTLMGKDSLLQSEVVTNKKPSVKDTLSEDNLSKDSLPNPKADTAEQDSPAKAFGKMVAKDKEKDEPAFKSFSSIQKAKVDSIIKKGGYERRGASIALNSARTLKNNFSQNQVKIEDMARKHRRFQISWYQKYTQAFACIVMFMIGAPLGAIIKKGGLGMPVLFSIIFFILYYMLTITGEKWAKEGLADPLFGTWFSNLALIPFGIFFLRQARKDARLFDPDMYKTAFGKLKNKLKRRRN